MQIRDAYASVNKALRHSAIHANRKLIIEVIELVNIIFEFSIGLPFEKEFEL